MRVEAAGAALHVRDAPGAAPPLCLLHAFPFSGAMWEPQLAALEGRRVLVPDVRGSGRSELGDGQYTLELLVDDLLAVLDAAGVERVVGCGLSMGGYILLRALERAPERFAAAALCDTRAASDSDEGRLGRARAMRAVKEHGLEPFADDFLPRALAPKTRTERPELVDRVRSWILEATPLGVAGQLLAMAARTDTTEALARIEVLVLVLVGEEDALTPPATARAMADRIPDAELAVIPGAGHLSNLENPASFNERLRGFLGRVAAG